LPKELAKTLPKSRLLTEAEWRGIGVQQSRGWQHYAIHRYVTTNKQASLSDDQHTVPAGRSVVAANESFSLRDDAVDNSCCCCCCWWYCLLLCSVGAN